MTATRVSGDGSLRLGDALNDWRAAWLIPLRLAATPDVLALMSIDVDRPVTVTRADLEALRQWIDEQLARNPSAETIDEPTNDLAILGPGGRRVDISAARHGAPALDPWHACDEDACERQHWLKDGYRYHAAVGVPEPPLHPQRAGDAT